MSQYRISWVKHQTESILEDVVAKDEDAARTLAENDEPHPTDVRWVMESEPAITYEIEEMSELVEEESE